jgi:quercetin dioxygenase-like cupin family protein
MKLRLLLSIYISVLCLLLLFDNSFAQNSSENSVKSTQILQTKTTWDGVSFQYPETESPEITALHIEFAPGSETTWHRHPVPSLAYILSGELEVTLRESGETKIFREGDAFAEVINTWHYGKNIGDEPVNLVVFYLGEEGLNLTEIDEKGDVGEP